MKESYKEGMMEGFLKKEEGPYTATDIRGIIIFIIGRYIRSRAEQQAADQR